MKTKNYVLLTIFALFGFSVVQAQTLLPKLQELFGTENVVTVDSSAYKEYYKINVPMPIDHNDKNKGTYLNRILLGFNEISSPVVMESGPYGFYPYQEKISYKTEVAELLNDNQIIVEHRYFGKSIPDSNTFKYLTYKQVSDDFHHIRQKLNAIFPNKWVATGHSKGADAVLAYKFYYPKDVEATVGYGINLCLEAEDKRFDEFLAEKRKTEDGKKLYEDQLYLLKNKKRLLPAFSDFLNNKDLFFFFYFEDDVETLYDYSVLELAVEFWQYYGNYEKYKTSTIENYESMLEMFKPKVAPTNFQDQIIYRIIPPPNKLKPHYYQAFTEGAYYGYDEKPFRKYLKNKDYPINFFAGQETVFDNSFRKAELKWIETEMEHLLLILADTDPWSVICPIPFPPDKDNLKVMLKNSNHYVKLKDFDEETRNSAVLKLKSWLGE